MSGTMPLQTLRSRLKMRQLLLLNALGETGNLRRSASRLGMTQPAATKLLQDLEAAAGVQLFERSRRGMAPTLYGEAMIRFANSLLAELDAVGAELHALSEGASGSITAGIMTSTVSEVLPLALGTMLERHPKVRVALKEGTHEMLLAALKRGDLDFVLGRIMGGAALDDVDLEILYEDEFVVVCGPGHPLLRQDTVSLSDTAGLRWILPHSTTPLRQLFEWTFMEVTGTRPQNALECASLLTNLALLQQNTMLSVMPADVVRQFAGHGLVRRLPVPLSSVYGPVALITRANRPHSPAVAAFLDQLRAAAAHLQPRREAAMRSHQSGGSHAEDGALS